MRRALIVAVLVLTCIPHRAQAAADGNPLTFADLLKVRTIHDLALRRLHEPVVFLQHRGEPHHLQEQTNQLDYSIKMKQFFDHHLKGEPAPIWWSEGMPCRGD